ncbi:MAG: hypothetical protein G01um101466_617 [Parcubacteria group bacterium Gr01-1014_66]|nr:MAG: hypothetical protein G01um101466_617 [Parcubacteria group bacterium Gr01-1014_66]
MSSDLKEQNRRYELFRQNEPYPTFLLSMPKYAKPNAFADLALCFGITGTIVGIIVAYTFLVG